MNRFNVKTREYPTTIAVEVFSINGYRWGGQFANYDDYAYLVAYNEQGEKIAHNAIEGNEAHNGTNELPEEWAEIYIKAWKYSRKVAGGGDPSSKGTLLFRNNFDGTCQGFAYNIITK